MTTAHDNVHINFRATNRRHNEAVQSIREAMLKRRDVTKKWANRILLFVALPALFLTLLAIALGSLGSGWTDETTKRVVMRFAITIIATCVAVVLFAFSGSAEKHARNAEMYATPRRAAPAVEKPAVASSAKPATALPLGVGAITLGLCSLLVGAILLAYAPVRTERVRPEGRVPMDSWPQVRSVQTPPAAVALLGVGAVMVSIGAMIITLARGQSARAAQPAEQNGQNREALQQALEPSRE